MPTELKSAPRLIKACLLAMLAGLLLFASHLLFHVGGGGTRPLFDHWLYDGLLVAAALICLARVPLRAEDRAGWAFIGAGVFAYAFGEIYWTVYLSTTPHPPFPSPADVGYLGFYPLECIGLGLLVKAHLDKVRASMLLDALLAALAVTSIGVEVLLGLAVHNAEGSALQ